MCYKLQVLDAGFYPPLKGNLYHSLKTCCTLSLSAGRDNWCHVEKCRKQIKLANQHFEMSPFNTEVFSHNYFVSVCFEAHRLLPRNDKALRSFVSLLAKYFKNKRMNFNEIQNQWLNIYRLTWSQLDSKWLPHLIDPSKHKNVLNSDNCTDIELKCGLVVAESHPHTLSAQDSFFFYFSSQGNVFL